MSDKPVIIATDLGPAAARVVEAGLSIAASLAAPPVLLHVDALAHLVSDAPSGLDASDLGQMQAAYRNQALRGMQELVRAAGGDADEIEVTVRQGRAHDEIVDEARERDALAIVVGSHVRTGFERLLVGRTALRVVREGPCGVFTVDVHRSWRGISRILFATDLGAGAQAAEHWAAHLTGVCGARLTVLHVAELSDNLAAPYVIPPRAKDAIQATLEERLSGLKLHLAGLAAGFSPGPTDVAARLFSAHDPAAGIIAAAKEEEADLIVTATHGRHGIARVLLGSVAEGVLNGAPCAVLTVRDLPAEEETD